MAKSMLCEVPRQNVAHRDTKKKAEVHRLHMSRVDADINLLIDTSVVSNLLNVIVAQRLPCGM